MNSGLQNAIERLVAVLEAENAALRMNDFGGIGAFITEKHAAIDALADIQAGSASNGGEPAERSPRGAGALQTLAYENKRLLERGMLVQNRIMSILAGAARKAQVPAGYGSNGHRSRAVTAGAVALITRV